MTYRPNVFGGTLSLTQSINQSIQLSTVRVKKYPPPKLFAIFSLVVNLCNWKKIILVISQIYSYVYTKLVHLYEYLY